MVGTAPARIQAPMSEPTTSRISSAPTETDMPWLMPRSIVFHECPLRTPTSAAAPAERMSAIWLGPLDDVSPNRATDAASRHTSNPTGISACPTDGARGSEVESGVGI